MRSTFAKQHVSFVFVLWCWTMLDTLSCTTTTAHMTSPDAVYERMALARELGLDRFQTAIGGPTVLRNSLVFNSGKMRRT